MGDSPDIRDCNAAQLSTYTEARKLDTATTLMALEIRELERQIRLNKLERRPADMSAVESKLQEKRVVHEQQKAELAKLKRPAS